MQMNCREGSISWDAMTQISRQNSLEFTMESLHFLKADIYVDVYELFIGYFFQKWPRGLGTEKESSRN
jgi:hypothetical protein